MPSLAVISTSAALISSACARFSSAQGPAIKTSGRSLPRVMSPIVTWRGVIAGSSNETRLVQRGADEGGEQRVRLERSRFELGMELHTDIPRMSGELDYFG